MKKMLIAVALTLAAGSAYARDTYVKPYTKNDGTYVEGHHRSAPNSNRFDNYNSQGNSNPYTGERGSERNEYSSPPEYNQRPAGTNWFGN